MKDFLGRGLQLFVYFLLSLRYRIKVIGKKNLPQNSGILFLSNHTAEIDPVILLSTLWFPFKPHPVAIDYLFRKPFVRTLLHLVGAFRIASLDTSSNSYKRKAVEKTFHRIVEALDRKENLLIYPAGGLKSGPEEVIGGASGIARILEARPHSNIVLIRVTGLWGSSFSKALTGKTPDLGKAFLNGFKVILRNGLFFVPRRKVQIEIEPAPNDFPWGGSRLEINRYLEKWYNQKGPEPLNLVSFSCFKKEFPAIREPAKEDQISLEGVPTEVREGVIEEIAKLTRVPLDQIVPPSFLAQDLGLDSLDIAQLVVSIKERFGVQSLHSSDLKTVGSVMVFAAKLKKGREEENGPLIQNGHWRKENNRPLTDYPEGTTIPEVFFKSCERMDGYLACVDQMAGEISYRRLKMGVLLLTETIRKLPGERIGIMMPASVVVNVMILGAMLAGKIPVMINWTLGERNLRSVAEQSQIQVTLSSWNFLDRLDNIELGDLDDQILFFEEVRRQFSLWNKFQAYYRSLFKSRYLLKILKADRLQRQDTAVILFTSGTESFPKGVPLTHENLLANQRGAYSLAKIESSDVLLGALPAFHSFGFSVTGLFPLLAGLKVAYSPNPTDGKRMAEAVERWEVTLLCLAPTFLKNLLRVATGKQLKSLRLVVAGAEKTAPEIYKILASLNNTTQLLEGYGITECAPILTLNLPDEPHVGVGVPLPGVEVMIVNPETYEPLPLGQQGLILVRGPNVFPGYLDPKLPSPFVERGGERWYQTGDLGYLNPHSSLTLSGRLKRFVKIGWEMVSLTAIEETLLQSLPKKGWTLDPEMPHLAVCAREQEGKKGEIHLFTPLSITIDEVNHILRENGMSNIIKVRSIIKVPYIPLLGTGKIDYRRLSSKLDG
jgi:long-chain-fatty-acid--[acyl-carrier-protein] ligase